MDEKTRREAINTLRRHGFDVADDENESSVQDLLDDAVHEAVSESAAAINNSGVDEQLEYLQSMLPDALEPTNYVAKFELDFFEYDQPEFGGRVDLTTEDTLRESVYAYVQELIDSNSLPYKFGPKEKDE